MALNCQKVYDRLIHYLNSELHPAEYTTLEHHLAGCAACQAEYEQLNNAIGLLRDLPEPAPPAGLVHRIRQRIAAQQQIMEFSDDVRTAPWDIISLIYSKLMVALKLGPRPAYVNYAALFCYLMLGLFLIKLTFWTGHSSSPQSPVLDSTSHSDVTSAQQSGERYIIWARVKKAGLMDVPNRGGSDQQWDENPPILRPLSSRVLHYSGDEATRTWPRRSWHDIPD